MIEVCSQDESDNPLSLGARVPFILNGVPIVAGDGSSFNAREPKVRIIFNFSHFRGFSALRTLVQVGRLNRLRFQFCNAFFQRINASGQFLQVLPDRCLFEDFQNV